MLPFSGSMFKKNENYLVNENRRIADERGVDYIKVIPKNYRGQTKEPMVIKIVELNWILTDWWKVFITGLIIYGIFMFLGSFLTVDDMIKRLDYTYDLKLELPFSMITMIDFVKDLIYI